MSKIKKYCEITVDQDTFKVKKCDFIGISHCQKYKKKHAIDKNGYVKCLKCCENPFSIVFDKN